MGLDLSHSQRLRTAMVSLRDVGIHPELRKLDLPEVDSRLERGVFLVPASCYSVLCSWLLGGMIASRFPGIPLTEAIYWVKLPLGKLRTRRKGRENQESRVESRESRQTDRLWSKALWTLDTAQVRK